MIDEKLLLEKLEHDLEREKTKLHEEDASLFLVVVCSTLRTVIDIIKKQKKIEWIPCSNELPSLYQNVLVCTKYRKLIIAYRRFLDDAWIDMQGNVIPDVVAWQPTPEPYESKRRKAKK